MPECAMDGCARPAPDAWVCHQCGQRTANSLTEAGRLWPELSTTVTRQARHGTPGPRPRGRAPAAPIRPDSGRLRHYADQDTGWAGGLVVDLAASDVGDVVRSTASTWARVIAEERWPDGRPGRPAGPWCAHDCGHGSCVALWEGSRAQGAYDEWARLVVRVEGGPRGHVG